MGSRKQEPSCVYREQPDSVRSGDAGKVQGDRPSGLVQGVLPFGEEFLRHVEAPSPSPGVVEELIAERLRLRAEYNRIVVRLKELQQILGYMVTKRGPPKKTKKELVASADTEAELYLQLYEQLGSYKKVSEFVGRSKGTVAKRLVRARSLRSNK